MNPVEEHLEIAEPRSYAIVDVAMEGDVFGGL
jgi:hypothetical protein